MLSWEGYYKADFQGRGGCAEVILLFFEKTIENKGKNYISFDGNVIYKIIYISYREIV